MKEEIIKSVGIDIGTSTTQLIFSEMKIKDIAGFGKIPQTEIVDKNIIYRSNIYFTPLKGSEFIDAAQIYKIVKREYEMASVKPKDLATGAVIITGESMAKRNAKQVVEKLSSMVGDFVVATAGPDLESILAGKGAGAADLSKKTGKIVANLDIGGGTTNICYFRDGEVYDTACLDIGGRLIRVEDRKIVYIASKVKEFAKRNLIDLEVGKEISDSMVIRLTNEFANILAQAVGLVQSTKELEYFKTNRLISVQEKPDILTFSGGVALCMEEESSTYAFGDIGVFLAKSIKENINFKKIQIAKALETMQATVIGAGNYSMNLSGSTIEYTEKSFPIKNLPIGKIRLKCEEDIAYIEDEIRKVCSYFSEDGEEQIAIAMEGLECPSFTQIQQIAKNIMKGYEHNFNKQIKIILMIEADIGKALGQALKRINQNERVICCIDNISCGSGDYIDIGQPVANGKAIPVVVKTLVFWNNPNEMEDVI